MVLLKERGKLKGELLNHDKSFLKELCYLLDLPYSGTIDKKISTILASDFSSKYVRDKIRLLDFSLEIVDHFYSKELSGIIKEFKIPSAATKIDKIVEIIKSEKVTPHDLIGMLDSSETKLFYENHFEKEPKGTIDKLIIEILADWELISKPKDTGFILMPMQKKGNNVHQIIKEVSSQFNINTIRIDDVHSSEMITKEIIEKIENSNIIFVDLSYGRPNVYYELGYAHGLKIDKKRIILMAKKGTKLHFDIAGMRTIMYSSSNDLKKKLAGRLKGIKKELK